MDAPNTGAQTALPGLGLDEKVGGADRSVLHRTRDQRLPFARRAPVLS
jgi:hypothetical protein